MQEIKAALSEAVKNLFEIDIEPELGRPDEKFGDFSTNVALKLASQTKKNPREIAVALASQLHDKPGISEVKIDGPGFINIKLTDQALIAAAKNSLELPQALAGLNIVAEYSDPNPFKVLHAGHLYTSIVGDAIANLQEAMGATVHRVNFGGDVGLHVAKTMWGIIGKLGGEFPEKLKQIPENSRADWMAEEYVTGSLAYGDDEKIDNEIKELNKRIYEIVEKNDHSSSLAQIYWTTRQWSYEYFENFYKRIGTKFEKYYPESQTAGPGLKIVKENIGKVFEESERAVVFKGEVHNLHTRVFINSQGLPTYETKDIGLVMEKWQDYHFDKSIVITGNEIYEYMQVVLKALEQIKPELAKKTVHLIHGMVKMTGAEKMSSRRGNILKAEDLLDATAQANQKSSGKYQPEVALGAVKYSLLKHRLGADIVYDPKESISLEGNSGPYLQYAYARSRSILSKASEKKVETEANLEPLERSLARKISEFPETVQRATTEYLPSHITTYLYELAQTFNRFYEHNRVIGDERQQVRVNLVNTYSNVLKKGLEILNIEAPEKI